MTDYTDVEQQTALRARLDQLKIEHRKLDGMIGQVSDAAAEDRLEMQRLKKRKLHLKDEITRIGGLIVPDIIA